MEKQYLRLPIDELIPYENNPRINDDAVDAVAKSIEQCGYIAPIITDESMVIMGGHTRVKAMKRLGIKECEVLVVSGLSEEQKRKYRLLDNKTNELAQLDFEKLIDELEGLDFDDIELDWGVDIEENNDVDDKYTAEVNIPQYEITGDCPSFADMLDDSKTAELIADIEGAEDITDAEREFLISAAMRHLVFNYRNIAEYYAHATPTMQRLMEKSALVIIDFNDAIANGYVKLSKDIENIMGIGGDSDA